MEFISTVADTFNIPDKDFELIRDFVLSDGSWMTNLNTWWWMAQREMAAGNRSNIFTGKTSLVRSGFIHIHSTNLYFVKYVGQAELYMNGQLLEPL